MGNSFVNLLEGFEKLAYKLLIWIILIPKTIIKIILNPGFALDYVHDELTNDKTPFDEYMSPVLLYLGVTLIPAVLLYFLPVYGSYLLDPETGKAFKGQDWTVDSNYVIFGVEAKLKSDPWSLYHQVFWEVYQDCDYLAEDQCNEPIFLGRAVFSEWTDDQHVPPNQGAFTIQDYDFAPDYIFNDMDYGYFTIEGNDAIDYWMPMEFKRPGSYRLNVTVRNFIYEEFDNPIETYTNTFYIEIPPPDYSEEPDMPPKYSTIVYFSNPKAEDKEQPKNINEAFANSQTLLIGMGLLIPPLIFAMGMNLFRKKEEPKAGLSNKTIEAVNEEKWSSWLTESALKEVFYAQCYYFVPIGLTVWSWYYSDYFYTKDIPVPQMVNTVDIYTIPIWIVVVWFLIVEARAIAQARKMKSAWRAIPIVAICVIITFSLVIAFTENDISSLRKFSIGFYPAFVIFLALWAIGSAIVRWWGSKKGDEPPSSPA